MAILTRLGRLLADDEVVVLLDVVDDRLVHLVAGDADRGGVDHAGQRDDGDLGRAAADVDNHVAGRRLDRQADADGRGDGFGHEVDLAGARRLDRVAHRALLDFGDARRHADDDPGPDEQLLALDHADVGLEHDLDDAEVGDDAVLHRPDDADALRRPAEHPLGLGADRHHLVGHLVDGDDGRLAQLDALALDVNQGRGGAEVDRDVVGEALGDASEEGVHCHAHSVA